MSQVIDERIVEMRFDNSDFESNVSTTMGTLEKLKSALQFKDETKGLDNITGAMDGISFDQLNSGIDTAKEKFSLLEQVAFGALTRIGEKLVDGTLDLAKSVSIDQVTAGFDKYAEKTKSVQTIMAATAGQIGTRWADENEQLDYVNNQLDRLMWFTDETSYNFTDMVGNIGKFTAAGVDIDTAVNSMMGIATWAAKSGAGIQGASRAMYNLSQAMGMGYLKVIDWKSIEQANMGTLEFKQTALETAAALGKLTKYTDDDGNLLGYLGEGTLTQKAQQEIKAGTKSVEDYLITAENMRESLSEGWFDKDVMNSVFGKYGEYAQKMSTWYENTDLTATETRHMMEDLETKLGDNVTGVDLITEAFGSMDEAVKETGMSVDELTQLGDDLMFDEFGRSAFEAAQQARTFQEAIDATKDAVSTGWSRTFEFLFGDYLQAKELWTELSERLYTLFMSGTEKRNEALKQWNEWGGYDILWEGVWNIWDAVGDVCGEIAGAFDEVFWGGPETLMKMSNAIHDFSEWIQLSDESLDNIHTAATGVADVFRGTWIMIRDALTMAMPLFSAGGGLLKSGGSFVLKVLASIGKTLTDVFVTASQFTTKLASGVMNLGVLQKVSGIIKGIGSAVSFAGKTIMSVVDGVTGPLMNGINWVVNTIGTTWQDITKGGSVITKAVLEPISKAFKNMTDWFNGDGENFFERVENFVSGKITNFGKGTIMEPLKTFIKDAELFSVGNLEKLSNGLLKYSNILKDQGLKAAIKTVWNDMPNIWHKLKDTAVEDVEKIKSATNEFAPSISKAFSNVKNKVSNGIDTVYERFGIDETSSRFEKIKAVMLGSISAIGKGLESGWLKIQSVFSNSGFKTMGEKLGNILDGIRSRLVSFWDGLKSSNLGTTISTFFNNIGTKIKEGINKAHSALVNLPQTMSKLASTLGKQMWTIIKSAGSFIKGLFDSDLVQGIIDGIKSIPEKASGAGALLGTGLLNIFKTGFNFVSGLIGSLFGPVVDGISNAFHNLWGKLTSTGSEGAQSVGEVLGTVIGNIGVAIKTAFQKVFSGKSVSDIVDVVNKLLVSGLLASLIKLNHNLSQVTGSLRTTIADTGKLIGSAFASFMDAFESQIVNGKNESFANKIAPYIGIIAVVAALALAFYKLSSLDESAIERGSKAIGVIMASLAGLMLTMNGFRIGDRFQLNGVTSGLSKAMQLIAVAAMVISIMRSIIKMADIAQTNTEGLFIATGIVLAVLYSLTKMVQAIGSMPTLPKGSTGKLAAMSLIITALSAAINAIVLSVAVLSAAASKFGLNNMYGALSVVLATTLAIIGAVVATLASLDYFKINTKKNSTKNLLALSLLIASLGLAISGIMNSIAVLTAAVGFAKNSDAALKAIDSARYIIVTVIGGVMAIMATMNLMKINTKKNSTKNLLALSAMIAAMGIAISSILNSISILAVAFNNISTGQGAAIATALGTIALVIGGVIAMMVVLNKFPMKAGAATSLLSIAVILTALGNVAGAMGVAISAIGASGASLGVVIAFVAGLAAILGVLCGMLPLAAAAAGAAPVLLSIAVVLVAFTAMLMGLGPAMVGIAAGITALFGAFIGIGAMFDKAGSSILVGVAAFAGLMTVLTLLTPLLVVAGVGLTVFGVGLLAVSSAFALFAAAVTALGAASTVVKNSCTTIEMVMASLGRSLGEFATSLFKGLGEASIELGEALYKLLSEAVPRAIEGLLEGLANVSDHALTYIPTIVEKLAQMLEAALTALEPYAYDIGLKGGSVLAKLCEGLADGIGESGDVVATILGTIFGAGLLFKVASFAGFGSILKGIGIAAEIVAGIGVILLEFKAIGYGLQQLDDQLGGNFASGLDYIIEIIQNQCASLAAAIVGFGAIFEVGGMLGVGGLKAALIGIGLACEIVAGIGAIIAECKTIGAALQVADDIFGGKFADGMTYLFETLGKAFGAFTGSFAGQAVQSMNDSITCIDSLKELINTVNSIDPASAEGLSTLKEAMQGLTEIDWDWFNEGEVYGGKHTSSSGNTHSGGWAVSHLQSMKEVCKGVREAISELGDGITAEDAEKLKNIATAINDVVEALGPGMESNSFVSFFTGKVDFSNISKLSSFSELGTWFKSAVEPVKDLSVDDITGMSQKLTAMAEGFSSVMGLFDELKFGGVISSFTGSNIFDESRGNAIWTTGSLTGLLGGIIGKIKGDGGSDNTEDDVSQAVKVIQDLSDSAKVMGESLRELFTSLTGEDGALNMFEELNDSGVTRLDLATSSLPKMAEGFKAIIDVFKDLSEDGGTKDIAKIFKTGFLGGDSDATVITDGIKTMVSSINDIFGGDNVDLASIGTKITNFQGIANGLGALAPVLTSMSELANSDAGVDSISDIGNKLPTLINGIKKAVAAMNTDIGKGGVTGAGAIEQFAAIAPMIKTSLQEITEALTDSKLEIPSDAIDVTGLDTLTTRLREKIQEALNNAMTGTTSSSMGGPAGPQGATIKIGTPNIEFDAAALQSTIKSNLDAALQGTIEATMQIKATISAVDVSGMSDRLRSAVQQTLSSISVTGAVRLIINASSIDTSGLYERVQSAVKLAIAQMTVSANVNVQTTGIMSGFTLGQPNTAEGTSYGQALGNAIANGISSCSGACSSAAASLTGAVVNACAGAIGQMNSIGVNIGQGLINGISSQAAAAYAAGLALGKAAAAGVKAGSAVASPSKITLAVGGFIGQGLVLGMNGTKKSVYKSGYDLGDTATAGAKDALDINSPSKVWEAIGRNCGQGFANGLAESAVQTIKSVTMYSEMLTEIIAAETTNYKQSKIQNAEDLLSYYEDLGIMDSRIKYAYYKRLTDMTDDQLKDMVKDPEAEDQDLEKDMLDKKREIHKTLVDVAKEVTEYYKDLADTGLGGRTIVLQTLYDTVESFSEEEKAALTEPYVEAVKALRDYQEEVHDSWSEFQKSQGMYTLADDLAYYQEQLKRYDPDSDAYLETLQEIADITNDMKDQHVELAEVFGLDTFEEKLNNALEGIGSMKKDSEEWLSKIKEATEVTNEDGEKWLENMKDYDRIGIAGELEAYYRLAEERRNQLTKTAKESNFTAEQFRAYLANDETLNSYKKQIYDLQKSGNEAIKQRKEAEKEAKDAYKEFKNGQLTTSMHQLWTEDEELIEKMSDNTQSLRDTLQDRRKEFREYFGLFDEVKEDFDETTISEMIFNQNDQAEYLKYYTTLMEDVESKIKDKDIMSSLQEMGIDAMPYLRALSGADSKSIDEFVTAWKTRDEAAKKAAEASSSQELADLIEKEKKKGEEAGKAYQEAFNEARQQYEESMYGEDPTGKKAAAAGARMLDLLQDEGFTNLGTETSALTAMYFEGTKNGITAMQTVSDQIDRWMSSGILQEEWIYGLTNMFHNMTKDGTFDSITEEDFMHIKDTVMSMSAYGLTAGAANIGSIADLDALKEEMFSRTIDGPLTISFGEYSASAVAKDISFTRVAAQTVVDKMTSMDTSLGALLRSIETGKVKLVLDTGALVGEMQADIDQSLGSSTVDSRSDFSM